MFGLVMLLAGLAIAAWAIFTVVTCAVVVPVAVLAVLRGIAVAVVATCKEIYRLVKIRTWADLKARLLVYWHAYPNYCKRWQAEEAAKNARWDASFLAGRGYSSYDRR